MPEPNTEEPDKLALTALDVLRTAPDPLTAEQVATQARLTPLGVRVALRALDRLGLAHQERSRWSSKPS